MELIYMIKLFAIIIIGIFVLCEIYMFIFDLIDKIKIKKETAIKESNKND